MGQNNGLEAKISEEVRTTIMMDLQEIFLHLIKTPLQGPTSHMKTNTRTIEDHMINAQTSHSLDMMEIDLEMDLFTTRMGTGETMELFLIPHQPKEKTSQKKTPTANQEVSNPRTLHSADLTVDQRLVLRPVNKNFRKTKIRHHLMWFVSPQRMIPITNYRILAR